MGWIDCISEWILVVSRGSWDLWRRHYGPDWIQQHCGGPPGSGAAGFSDSYLTGIRSFDRSGLASSPSHNSVLLHWLLPRLGVSFPIGSLANTHLGVQGSAQRPSPRWSIPFFLRVGIVSTLALITLLCNYYLCLSLLLDYELLKGRDWTCFCFELPST